jgi:cobalt/nickel transport system permease protein
MPLLPNPIPQTMHIPDGFLSAFVSIVFWIISISILTIALRKSKAVLAERDIPLMGVLAAAIFSGQMLNFAVAGGTSGHLLGAALATILLGPWPAVVVMSAVVTVQAVIFQDGGLLALGTNLFNMAVVGVFVAYAVYTLSNKMIKSKSWGGYVAGFLAAWSSIVIASLACGLQLGVSGTSPVNLAVPMMAGVHALIGIGEGLITTGALAFFSAVRKDVLLGQDSQTRNHHGVVISGGLLSLLLVVLSPLASNHPDGLEWVAKQIGFISKASDSFYSIIPDYSMPGINNAVLATIISGLVGMLIVFAVIIGVMRARKLNRPSEEIQ